MVKHAPTGHLFTSIFSDLLFERHSSSSVAWIAEGYLSGGWCVVCLWQWSPILEKLLNCTVAFNNHVNITERIFNVKR